jgi:dihydropteroate synthase
MGILNTTPDSFFGGSRTQDVTKISERIKKMVVDGVDIIDVGAYSSRPQASVVSEQEEMSRLNIALEILVKDYPTVPISVDTFRSGVAKHVHTNFGVGIINDISGGTLDENMFDTVAQIGVAYILMHMRGNPATMQSLCIYNNVVSEVLDFLQKQTYELNQRGVTDVIIDPGFGFAKTTELNFTLLKNLEVFSTINAPLLVGLSRKSMIYKTLGIDPDNALTGTIAANFAALTKGAKILRVHDVKEAKETIAIFEALR